MQVLVEVSPGKYESKPVQGGSNNEVFVSNLGLSGTPHTQTIKGLGAARQFLKFDPPIKGVKLTAKYADGTLAADVDEAALYCIDPPTDPVTGNSPVADDWLNEANTAPRDELLPNGKTHEIRFSAPVTYLHFIGIGTSPDLDITAVGIV